MTVQDNLDAYVATTGVVTPSEKNGASKGCTLANATTYYIPIPATLAAQKALLSVQVQWAAALAAVITLEICDVPTADASAYVATAGIWQPVNPPNSYVPVTGSGNSASAATVTAGGTTDGTAVFEISAFASRRLRLKVVVTTGALARFLAFGKS